MLSQLVIGVSEKNEIILVNKESRQQHLVFEGPSAMKSHLEVIQLESMKNEIILAKARELCSTKKLRDLKYDGLAHFPGIIDEDLIKAAKKRVNYQLGKCKATSDLLHMRSSDGKIDEIGALFNKSILPHLLQVLLDTPEPFKQSTGQIALRFPGDMCLQETGETTSHHFDELRKHWHIDGCASDHIPGQTDHFGEVHNFDALIGILLADVEKPMSGELCYYPGSHFALAEYFKGSGLEKLYREGAAALPNGPKTDSIFHCPPMHCVGKKGDVFIANFLTAHFIAPNTSSEIRYAIYYRIQGPKFIEGSTKLSGWARHNRESLLDPWVNWTIMDHV